MKFGLDRLLSDPDLRKGLKGRRVALLAHPASVTADLTHAVDALAACDDITLTALFGPQHGMKDAEEVATVPGMDGGADYVALEARIELPLDAEGPFGLSAVIETIDGAISYWALAHPAEKPDFHHPDSFVLTLPESSA